jgi:hypothetical protein
MMTHVVLVFGDGQPLLLGRDGQGRRRVVHERRLLRRVLQSGTDVRIFEIFSPKNLVSILAFFAQTSASFRKVLIIILVSENQLQRL